MGWAAAREDAPKWPLKMQASARGHPQLSFFNQKVVKANVGKGKGGSIKQSYANPDLNPNPHCLAGKL